MNKTKTAILLVGALFAAPALIRAAGEAPETPRAAINLSYPEEIQPLRIPVRELESLARNWRKGDRVAVRAWVEHPDGTKTPLKDRDGHEAWSVTLDEHGAGTLSVTPGPETFSGRVRVTAAGQTLFPTPDGEEATLEKIYEYRFPDGARIKVHFTDQILEQNGETHAFARDVLDAAVQAYQTITTFQGFSAPGFSFARPDKTYAFDPDSTVDIYLGGAGDENLFQSRPAGDLSFKDAPCFDTLKESGNRFDAVILVPANYRDFIKSWERINPSSLGKRNAGIDLKGTLMHEMLHVVLFYYNKNLNRGEDKHAEGANAHRKIDWYVEGLARYFETFAGARHDFFSQGFKQTLPDKIRFSRGGSNYFMRYPDQAFTDLRYENALFWRFIDFRYGMGVIEKMSRDFRGEDLTDFQRALEKATGSRLEDLLKNFAASILFDDFGLKDDAAYLKEIARTKLSYRNGVLSLRDGYGDEKPLGRRAAVDWIGDWDGAKARLGEAPVAGDNTPKSDVSAWATDFVEITFDAQSPELPWLGVWHRQGGAPLEIQVVVETRAGSTIRREIAPVKVGAAGGLSLEEVASANGLGAKDIRRVVLLITNTDSSKLSDYEIAVS